MFKKIIISLGIFAGAILFPAFAFGATYGSNFLTGGSCSVSNTNGSHVCENALDSNTATMWQTEPDQNHWWKYDLGSGITKIIAKTSLYPPSYNFRANLLEIYGSNNDTDYYLLTTTTLTATIDWQTFTWTPSSTAYRYYKFDLKGALDYSQYKGIAEIMAYECTDCGGSGPAPDTSSAYTEICYTGTTSTSCYRALDVYKSYLIDFLFIIVPLFMFAYFIKKRRGNISVKL